MSSRDVSSWGGGVTRALEACDVYTIQSVINVLLMEGEEIVSHSVALHHSSEAC